MDVDEVSPATAPEILVDGAWTAPEKLIFSRFGGFPLEEGMM